MVVIVMTKPAEKIVPGVRIGVVIRPSVTGPSVVKLKLCTKSPRSLCRSSVVVQQPPSYSMSPMYDAWVLQMV